MVMCLGKFNQLSRMTLPPRLVTLDSIFIIRSRKTVSKTNYKADTDKMIALQKVLHRQHGKDDKTKIELKPAVDKQQADKPKGSLSD